MPYVILTKQYNLHVSSIHKTGEYLYSMTKSIKANYLYDAAYQILAVITPFITTPYLSRVLKADGIGTISFVKSIVQYFALFAAMGIFPYGRREVSYLQDDRAERSRVFWNLKALALINALACITAYLVLTYIYADENYVLYLIEGINITYTLFDVGWLFAGMEEFRLLALRNAVIRVLNIVSIFLLVKSNEDIPVYMLVNVLFIIAGHVVIYPQLPKYIDAPNVKNIRPFHGIKTILVLFIPSIAAEVYTVLDKTMLGLFTSTAFENGYYESSLKISKIAMMAVLSMSNVMIPRMGYLFGKNDMQTIRTYMYRSFRFVWFLGMPVCFGLIGISDNFVPWFFGDGYMKVAGLLKITGFLVLAIGINNAAGTQYLIPSKRQTVYTLTITIGAAVNFCMNLILIPVLKSYGAAIASVIAESVIALSQLYVLRQELSIRKIACLCRKYLAAGIVMLSVLEFMSRKLAPSPVHTFIMILSGALIYFGVLVILRDDFFTENAYRALESIKQKFHH